MASPTQRAAAFERGKAAYKAGMYLSENPERDPDLLYSWDEGWYEAQEEANQAKESEDVQDDLS